MGVQVSALLKQRTAALYEVIAMAVVLLNEFGFSGEIFFTSTNTFQPTMLQYQGITRQAY